MSAKAVVPREAAVRDMEAAVDYHAREADHVAAAGFVEAIEACFRSIASHPHIGSPRYAHELDLTGLRSLRLKRYPFIIFYVAMTDRIDMWRILHAKRDIPSSFADEA